MLDSSEHAESGGWTDAFITLADNDRPAEACDDASIFWDGGGGTPQWMDPLNWSQDRLPRADDRVCIPETAIDGVHFLGGERVTEIGSLISYEKLYLHGGADAFHRLTLKLSTDSTTPSSLYNDVALFEYTDLNFDAPLTLMSGATFAWGGTAWIGGKGELKLCSGATFRVDSSADCRLPNGLDECRFIFGGRTITNNGTMLWNAEAFFNGPVAPEPSATLKNNGTVIMGDRGRLFGGFRAHKPWNHHQTARRWRGPNRG